MATSLEGVLAVYSQGVSSNVRGEHPLRGVDKTLNTLTLNQLQSVISESTGLG